MPHQLCDPQIVGQIFPGLASGTGNFFSLNWFAFSDFLTFKGGLNPVTGSLWMTDIAHHHVAIAVLFIIAGHMYRTNYGIGHSMKEILDAQQGDLFFSQHLRDTKVCLILWLKVDMHSFLST